MPRGKPEHAEQIIPKLREVEVELGRGKTVVSALSISPQRRRLGLLFDILDHNLTAEDFDLFVTRLLRKIRGPVTLVIDRLGAHRSAV